MHVIRLRQPWEREVVANVADVSDLERPVRKSDSEPDRVERVRFRRRFGQPTGLEPEDPIDLVIERVAANGHVWLNDQLLGAIVAGENAARFCLRGRLQARNLLLIEFELPCCFDGRAGEVRLEIRFP